MFREMINSIIMFGDGHLHTCFILSIYSVNVNRHLYHFDPILLELIEEFCNQYSSWVSERLEIPGGVETDTVGEESQAVGWWFIFLSTPSSFPLTGQSFLTSWHTHTHKCENNKHVCIDSEARSLTHSWSAEISGILSAVTQPCQASCANCTRVTAAGGLVQVCLCEFVCMQQQNNRHLAPVTNFSRFHCDTFETHIVSKVCSSLFVSGCVPASAQPSV